MVHSTKDRPKRNKTRDEMREEILESYKNATEKKNLEIKREYYDNDPIINLIKKYL